MRCIMKPMSSSGAPLGCTSRADHAIELRGVAGNRLELELELRRDVHHEGGFFIVLAVGETVEHLARPMRGNAGLELSDARKEARIPHQLRRDAMVGVVAAGRRGDHDPRREAADGANDVGAGLGRVHQSGIGKAEVLPSGGGGEEKLGPPAGLLARSCADPRVPVVTLGEIDVAGRSPGVRP